MENPLSFTPSRRSASFEEEAPNKAAKFFHKAQTAFNDLLTSIETLELDATGRQLVIQVLSQGLLLENVGQYRRALELFKIAKDLSDSQAEKTLSIEANINRIRLKINASSTPNLHGILSLPDDILIKIFSLLNQTDRMKIRNVCNQMREVMENSNLWTSIVLPRHEKTKDFLIKLSTKINKGNLIKLKLKNVESEKMLQRDLSMLNDYGTEFVNLTYLCIEAHHTPRGTNLFRALKFNMNKFPNLVYLELNTGRPVGDYSSGLLLSLAPKLEQLYLSGPQILIKFSPFENKDCQQTEQDLLDRFNEIHFYPSLTTPMEQVHCIHRMVRLLDPNPWRPTTEDVDGPIFPIRHTLSNLTRIKWHQHPGALLWEFIMTPNLKRLELFHDPHHKNRRRRAFSTDKLYELSQRTPKLETLHCPGFCKSGHDNLSLAQAIANWKDLRVLCLSYGEIGSDDLFELGSKSDLSKLEKLYLMHTRICGLGIMEFIRMVKLGNNVLHHVDVTGCFQIANFAIRALQAQYQGLITFSNNSQEHACIRGGGPSNRYVGPAKTKAKAPIFADDIDSYVGLGSSRSYG